MSDYAVPRDWEKMRPPTLLPQEWTNYVSLLAWHLGRRDARFQKSHWWKDARAMDAILQLAYHGSPVELRIGGGHDTVHWATYGGGSVSGSWETVRDALVADGQHARNGTPLRHGAEA